MRKRLTLKQLHSRFLDVTRQSYANMQARLEKMKLPPAPFTRDEFRAHMLQTLGGTSEGVAQCRYCRKFCTAEQLTADHMMPLSRGGSLGLENIGFPCQKCNQAKGSMTPEEFQALIDFLEPWPFARKDVLSRLSKAVKLAAGARRAALLRRQSVPASSTPLEDHAR